MDRFVDSIAEGKCLTVISLPLIVCSSEVSIKILVKGELKAGPSFLSYLSNILCQRSPFGCGHVAGDTSACTVVIVVAGV